MYFCDAEIYDENEKHMPNNCTLGRDSSPEGSQGLLFGGGMSWQDGLSFTVNSWIGNGTPIIQ
jgi:hypothetical protein